MGPGIRAGVRRAQPFTSQSSGLLKLPLHKHVTIYILIPWKANSTPLPKIVYVQEGAPCYYLGLNNVTP